MKKEEKNMKAAICTQYGSSNVIEISEIPKPINSSKEVLIKVMASAVNSCDVRIRGLKVNPLMRIIMRVVLGWKKPRNHILGLALSGVIEEVGSEVHTFNVGDEVFAMTGMRFGGHAQYAVLKESSAMVLKPKLASFEESAALLFGGTTAIHFLRKAKICKKDKVMIYGASGSVGTAAIQVAQYMGADVTAVCSHRHRNKILDLGIKNIIDYKTNEFKNLDIQFDIVFDAVGKINKTDIKHLLKPHGIFISVKGNGVASEKKEDLILIAKMFDQGKLKAVIDRTYPLDEIALAHDYVDKNIKTGNVAIKIEH